MNFQIFFCIYFYPNQIAFLKKGDFFNIIVMNAMQDHSVHLNFRKAIQPRIVSV